MDTQPVVIRLPRRGRPDLVANIDVERGIVRCFTVVIDAAGRQHSRATSCVLEEGESLSYTMDLGGAVALLVDAVGDGRRNAQRLAAADPG